MCGNGKEVPKMNPHSFNPQLGECKSGSKEEPLFPLDLDGGVYSGTHNSSTSPTSRGLRKLKYTFIP